VSTPSPRPLPANNPDGSGYRFDTAACTINGQPTGALNGQAINLNLPAGANAVCVFTNSRLPAPVIAGTITPPPPPAPRIAITKRAPKRSVGLRRFVYTIRVRNTAVSRRATSRSPTRCRVASPSCAPPAGPPIKAGTLTIKLGTLAPGRSRTVKLTVRGVADIRGRRTNTATATATGARTVRAKATTVFRKIKTRPVVIVTG